MVAVDASWRASVEAGKLVDLGGNHVFKGLREPWVKQNTSERVPPQESNDFALKLRQLWGSVRSRKSCRQIEMQTSIDWRISCNRRPLFGTFHENHGAYRGHRSANYAFNNILVVSTIASPIVGVDNKSAGSDRHRTHTLVIRSCFFY